MLQPWILGLVQMDTSQRHKVEQNLFPDGFLRRKVLEESLQMKPRACSGAI